MRVQKYVESQHKYICVHILQNMYTHTYIYTRIHVYIHTCVNVHKYIYVPYAMAIGARGKHKYMHIVYIYIRTYKNKFILV